MNLLLKEYDSFDLYKLIAKYADSENMAKRIFNAFYRMGIRDTETFYNKYWNNKDNLKYIRNIGQKSVKVLENVLEYINNNR